MSRILQLITPFESYFVSLQSILIWERPELSAIAFVGFNCLYWLVVSWNRRIYSIIALIAFSVSFVKLWCKHIWPEIRLPPSPDADIEGWTTVHPQILSAPEISHYLNESWSMINGAFEWLCDLRRNNRGIFCLLISSFFSFTAIIGTVIPGVVIVYIIMMTIALGPGLGLYLIPESWYQHLRTLLRGKENSEEERRQSVSEQKFTAETIEALNRSLSENLSDCDRSRLNETLDDVLGIRELNADHSDCNSGVEVDNRLSRGSSENSGINFVPTYFNGKDSRRSSRSEVDVDVDDYEVVTESDLQETEKILESSL